MSDQVPILSYTYDEYCAAARERLGKGAVHAGLLYSEFVRTGTVTGSDPAFANAQALYQALCAETCWEPPEFVKEVEAGGTHKILTRTKDGLELESVVIPMQHASTLCISSQVGCRMGCVFCETGRMGLLRNLTVAEIVGQVFVARFVAGHRFRNIVFMGMGEPLDNLENVQQALRVLTDPAGFCFARSRITVSTSGCVDGIYRLMESGDPLVNLAVSINAPTDALRDRLMPINRRFNLAAIHQAIWAYNQQTGRQVLLAYVLMGGFNDAPEHAEALVEWLKGLDIKVNLIPYNPQSRDRFTQPSNQDLDAFAARLRVHGVRTLVRHHKGRDIMAACGQLGNLKLRRRLAEKRALQNL